MYSTYIRQAEEDEKIIGAVNKAIFCKRQRVCSDSNKMHWVKKNISNAQDY